MASKQQKERQEQIPWVMNGIKIEPHMVPDWAIGFCYRITFYPKEYGQSPKVYVGRKMLTSTTRKRIGVREKANTGTRKTFKTTVKDSGWMSYNSSNKALAELINTTTEPHRWGKEIIAWAHSKKHLGYLEQKYQMVEELLEKESWVDNIGGGNGTKEI